MSVFKRGNVYWYHFIFAGRHIQEPAKTTSKTLARAAEQRRRRELEEGFNSVADNRKDRIRTVDELASEYLEGYKLRNRSSTFAEYALNHVKRLVGSLMVVDATERSVLDYQSTRLKEKAAPKTINEEVGFLLRLLGDVGDTVRARLRRKKQLKLKVRRQVGKAYSDEEKALLYEEARTRRSKAIYPALVLALNCGLRDKEIRCLQWGRMHLGDAYLVVGDTKTDAGTGRTVPLNSVALDAIREYAIWYKQKFGELTGMVCLSIWQTAAHGSDSTLYFFQDCVEQHSRGLRGKGTVARQPPYLITELAETGAGDETIQDIAGHVSKQMLKHYSHIRMEAKRKALQAIVRHKKGSQEKAG